MTHKTDHIYEFGPYRLDAGEHLLTRQGKVILLQPKVFDLLLVLVESHGHLLEKDELMKAVWPDTVVEEVNLANNISILRKTIGENGDPLIETVPKRGYRFVAVVSEVTPVGSNDLELPQDKPVAVEQMSLSDEDSDAPQFWSWRRICLTAGVVVLLAAAILFGFRWLAHRKSASSAPVIAVLPLKNLSTERESEHFVDGLTEEIIRNLSLIEGMEVRSQTSSFYFKDKPRNLREIGEQLKANLALEGSVLRVDGRVRINVQLVRVADDATLWSDRFDRELKDIFAIQDEISRSIVNELRLKLGRGRRRYETNFEAYDLYLKAQGLLLSTGNEDWTTSIGLFNQVIAKDASFAPAYAGISDAYDFLSTNVHDGHIDPNVAYAHMRPNAERALILDPLLAEGYSAMGLVYTREMDWVNAEKAFRRATELSPNLTSAYLQLAYTVLAPAGRVDEALNQLDKAERADPLSPGVRFTRGMVLINAGRYEEGIVSCRQALDKDPHNEIIKVHLARGLLQKGQPAEAIAILEAIDGRPILSSAMPTPLRGGALKLRPWP